MARYHGNKGVIYISSSGTTAATSTVSLSKWTLDKATDKADVTAFGDANKVYVQGLADVKGTISGWFDNADDSLFIAAASADGVKLYLYPASTAPTIYHYGPAWIDASMDTASSGPISIVGNFVANGAWGKKP